jgi:hypothetical protein
MAHEAAGEEEEPQQIFGPFHRLKSATQSDGATNMQVETQEIWGRAQEVSTLSVLRMSMYVCLYVCMRCLWLAAKAGNLFSGRTVCHPALPRRHPLPQYRRSLSRVRPHFIFFVFLCQGSDVPEVQAAVGELPEERLGIEFLTNVAPDDNLPRGQARWTGPRKGVILRDSFARIAVHITLNTQTERQSLF